MAPEFFCARVSESTFHNAVPRRSSVAAERAGYGPAVADATLLHSPEETARVEPYPLDKPAAFRDVPASPDLTCSAAVVVAGTAAAAARRALVVSHRGSADPEAALAASLKNESGRNKIKIGFLINTVLRNSQSNCSCKSTGTFTKVIE